MTRAITALFDTLAVAERAAQDLSINVGDVRRDVYDAKRSGVLPRLSIPGEGMATFNEGIRRGGAVLHAQVPEHRFDEAAYVLERDGAVDIDEREAGGPGKVGRAAPRRAAPRGSLGQSPPDRISAPPGRCKRAAARSVSPWSRSG